MGTDALRFTLLVGATPGNDMNLSVKKVEANRNFINKVWNAARFSMMNISNAPAAPRAEPQWTLADRWIRIRLAQVVRDVDRLFSSHQYGEAGRQIYDFFWSEFADWYVEISKMQMAEGADRAYYTAQTLVEVLDTSLRLLHPFIPFVTEEIWTHLKSTCLQHPAGYTPALGWQEALIVARFPEPQTPAADEEQIIDQFSLVMEMVRAIRNYRTENNITPGKKLEAQFYCGDKLGTVEAQLGSICFLAHLDRNQVQVQEKRTTEVNAGSGIVVSGVEIFLQLEGGVDTAAEKERLQKELDELNSQIDRLDQLLQSPFASKAPPAVVDKERQRMLTFQQSAEKLKDQLEKL